MYELKLTKVQAQVLSQALEVLARLGIGQFRDALTYLPTGNQPFPSGWHDDMDTIGRILAKYTTHGVDGYNSSLSIGGQDTEETAKVAWDMYQTIRHRLAWDNARDKGYVQSDISPRNWSKMMTVSYDEPMQLSKEPLASFGRLS